MEEKNRYLFLELVFTLFLLGPVIFLFGDLLSAYRLYLILGLIAGFSFSWLNRDKQSSLRTIFINLPVLGVFAWMVYSLLNSSLLYREVIITFIKGGIILEVIFSFNSAYPLFLTYIQALSLPLLMCFPVLVKDHNETNAVLVLVYIICWILILKIKLYNFLKPIKQKKSRRHFSILISAILFLIIIFISWSLFNRLSLGKIGKGGFLLQESQETKIDSETLEKEYYAMQDKVQEELSQLIPKLDSREERQEMLLMLSALIKDTSIVAEVKKAESALINRLKIPGPGLEKAKGDDIAIQIKNYLDRKIQFNLINLREGIINNLKKNRFNIMDKFSILDRINKMQRSGSYKGIKKYEKELNRIINNSSAKENIKRDLKEDIGQFKEWKVWELYHTRLESLNKEADSQKKEPGKEHADLPTAINKTEKLPEFQELKEKIERLKKTMPPEYKDTLKQTEELLDLKLEMFLSEKDRELKEKTEVLRAAKSQDAEEVRGFLEELKNIPSEKQPESPMDTLKEYLNSKRQGQGQKNKPTETKGEQQGGTGKGTEKSGEPSGKETKKLNLIKIIPDFLQVASGETGQFTALGIYSDNSQEDLTHLGDWSSSNDKIAVVSGGKIDTFSSGEARIYVKFKGVISLPALVKVEGPKLVSIILSPQNLRMSMRKQLTLKAEGHFSDSSTKGITLLVTWKVTNPRIIRVEKGKIFPLKFGETEVYAEYSDIKSPPANIKIIFTVDWLIYMIIKWTSFLFLGIAAMFILLYALTEKRKNNLKDSLGNNPAEFIVNLYENTKKILAIFNLSYNEHIPPLSYAELVQESYSIENDLFLRFTAKFEEARYSGHTLSRRDASLALTDYNDFLTILLSRYNKPALFLKYCLTLLGRIPLFIPNP